MANENSAVYETLRTMVINSAFEPGSRIRIDEVAEEIASGRTPVREALFQLSTENLVQFRYQKGFYAAEINARDLGELIKTKSSLEHLLLSDQDAKWDDTWETQLLVAFHVLKKSPGFSPEFGYVENREWLDAHRAFHRALVPGSTNQWGKRLIDILDSNLDRYRSFINGSHAEGDRQESSLKNYIDSLNTAGAHQKLYDLAMQRDFGELAVELADHNNGMLTVFSAYIAR